MLSPATYARNLSGETPPSQPARRQRSVSQSFEHPFLLLDRIQAGGAKNRPPPELRNCRPPFAHGFARDRCRGGNELVEPVEQDHALFRGRQTKKVQQRQRITAAR